MVRVLEKVGCRVHYNPAQTCCGQPAYNAGYKPESQQVAGKFLADFAGPDPQYIVSPSASCVGMVRNAYSELFAGTSRAAACQQVQRRTYDLTEFLVDVLGITQIPGAALAGKYTYHDSCAALRRLYHQHRRELPHAPGGLHPPRAATLAHAARGRSPH